MPSNRKKAAALALAAAAGFLIAASKYLREKDKVVKKKRRKRRCWVKYRGSVELEEPSERKEPPHYRKNLLMSYDDFQLLLDYVSKDITKKNTTMRMAYPAGAKLEATLRFLATGESYRRLETVTNLSTPFLSSNIPSICEAIYENLKEKYMKFPTTHKEWLDIADLFLDRWQFPFCLGAICEKKILFRSFRQDETWNSGQTNIKVLAITDADYKFIYVEMDCSGRANSESLFERSKLKEILKNSSSIFPSNVNVDDNTDLPYVFVSDKNIPLHERVMVPYSTEVNDKILQNFNTRINDVTDVVERSFEMLTHFFKITQTLSVKKEQMQSILLACFALHNFLMEHSHEYEDAIFNPNLPDSEDQEPVKEMILAEYEVDQRAEMIRRAFAEYFLKEPSIINS